MDGHTRGYGVTSPTEVVSTSTGGTHIGDLWCHVVLVRPVHLVEEMKDNTKRSSSGFNESVSDACFLGKPKDGLRGKRKPESFFFFFQDLESIP